MKFFTNEVKIAIVAIVGIVILFFGLNFLRGMSVFSNDNTYYIRLDDAAGLAPSNAIYADGYQVGIVKEVAYDYAGRGGVIVTFGANKQLHIPVGTVAQIQSDLMGNVKLNLKMAQNTAQDIAPGDTITGGVDAGVMGTVADLMPTVEQLLPKLDSILASVNMLLADPALANSLHNMQTISANLATTTSSLNTLVAGLNTSVPAVMNRVNVTLDKAGTTLDHTSTISAKLAAIDVEGTMAKVNHTLANVQQVTDRINSKDGTLGLLLNDPSLYYNLNSTIVSADSLLTNLKAHPKRYVHFSIFGRKDK